MEMIVITKPELRRLLKEVVAEVKESMQVEQLKRPYLYLQEAIDWFGGNISATKLRQLVDDGFLSRKYVGGKMVFLISELEQLPQAEKFGIKKAA